MEKRGQVRNQEQKYDYNGTILYIIRGGMKLTKMILNRHQHMKKELNQELELGVRNLIE